MNETGHSTIVPLKAFKGWLLAIQAQITGVVHGIDDQILFHENEIKRLKGQRERSRSVLTSMGVAPEPAPATRRLHSAWLSK